MKMKIVNIARPSRRILLAAALSLGLGTALAQTDTFPSKPVRIVVPWAAGGLADVGTRLIAKELEAKWKQPVIVENRPGGNEVVASQNVLAAPADGYTLYYQSQNVGLNPLVQKQNFGPKDFRMLGRNVEFSYILFTSPNVPANSLREFIALAKSKPGQISYGHSGFFTKLSGMQFADAIGTRFNDINYAGGTAIQTAVAGGHVDFYFGTTFDVSTFPPGKVKLLAATAAKRHSNFPDLPAISEVVPGFEVVSWVGYAVKAGTPDATVRKLAADINEAFRAPAVAKWHAERGLTILNETPEQSQAYVDRQAEQMEKLATRAGIVVKQ